MILASTGPVWALLCILTLLIDIYLIVGVIGLILALVFAPFRAAPYGQWFWGPPSWVGLVVAFILAYLFYPHCGFLKLPL
jgi:hypothetical protein